MVFVVMAQFIQSLPDFLVDNSNTARLIALRAQQPADSAGDVFPVVPGPPVNGNLARAGYHGEDSNN